MGAEGTSRYARTQVVSARTRDRPRGEPERERKELTAVIADAVKAGALLLFAALVQVSIASTIEVAEGHPNLVLVLVVALALLRGPIFGACAGFWAGLVLDVAGQGPLAVLVLEGPNLVRDARSIPAEGHAADLGYAEIAAVSALSPDAVRSRIHRSRIALRTTLTEAAP
mgnify:CR=1 FL=1